MATLTNAKSSLAAKILAALALGAIAVAGFALDEILLGGPIIFLVNTLGFWLGYVVCCLMWAGLGLFILTVWVRAEPWVKEHIVFKVFSKKERAVRAERPKPKSWRERLVLWFARMARILGILATAVVLGPVYGWPVYRLLGYKERTVYALTLGSTWLFGAIWVPFYSFGVWNLGLSRLF